MRENQDTGDEQAPIGSSGSEPEELISQYQVSYRAWEIETTPEIRDQVRKRMCASLTAVEGILREPLRREAYRWRRSRSFREILESLASHEGYEQAIDRFAMQMFPHILEKLPSVPVSRDHDIVGLLVVIARRGMAREERRIYKPPHLRTKQGATPLPVLRIGVARDQEGELALEVADEYSAEAMERALSRATQLALRGAIRDALASIRSPEDQEILAARLVADPALPYEVIARRLGEGWTEGAVRQRYRRARLQLREILKDYADD